MSSREPPPRQSPKLLRLRSALARALRRAAARIAAEPGYPAGAYASDDGPPAHWLELFGGRPPALQDYGSSHGVTGLEDPYEHRDSVVALGSRARTVGNDAPSQVFEDAASGAALASGNDPHVRSAHVATPNPTVHVAAESPQIPTASAKKTVHRAVAQSPPNSSPPPPRWWRPRWASPRPAPVSRLDVAGVSAAAEGTLVSEDVAGGTAGDPPSRDVATPAPQSALPVIPADHPDARVSSSVASAVPGRIAAAAVDLAQPAAAAALGPATALRHAHDPQPRPRHHGEATAPAVPAALPPLNVDVDIAAMTVTEMAAPWPHLPAPVPVPDLPDAVADPRHLARIRREALEG